MSEDGGVTVSCNSRYATPQYLRKQKDWLRLSLFKRSSPICNSNFRSLFEARPLSRGLVSTAHPCFLLFDTAKLYKRAASYLRIKKIFEKKFTIGIDSIDFSLGKGFGVRVRASVEVLPLVSIGEASLLLGEASLRSDHDCLLLECFILFQNGTSIMLIFNIMIGLYHISIFNLFEF